MYPDVFAPHHGVAQAVPHLQQSVVPSGGELRQSRVGRESPNFLGVAQHGRVETHFHVADENAVSRRADQQLGSPSFRERSNPAKVILNLSNIFYLLYILCFVFFLPLDIGKGELVKSALR